MYIDDDFVFSVLKVKQFTRPTVKRKTGTISLRIPALTTRPQVLALRLLFPCSWSRVGPRAEERKNQ